MSVIEKIECDSCHIEQSMQLNHVFTVAFGEAGFHVLRGLQRKEFIGGEVEHVCSLDCLSREISRWNDRHQPFHPQEPTA